MLMRMLSAGGLPPLTDHIRVADVHNPAGYFEYEPVKQLSRNASWLEDARGKAVKIIYRLLRYLPAHLPYRVIFVERDLSEVFESQREMLAARGDQAANQDSRKLIEVFALELRNTLDWLATQSNVQVLRARYEGIVQDPQEWSREISRFLGGGMNQDAMAAAVDPALHRQRRANSPTL